MENVFVPASIAGLTGVQRDFNVFRAGATLRLLDDVIPSAGIVLTGEAQRCDDRETGVLDFYR